MRGRTVSHRLSFVYKIGYDKGIVPYARRVRGLLYSDVLLVRHGESEANAAGRFASHTWDPHLTLVGKEQALQLAIQLHNAPIRYVVTSPLARAQETIEVLATDHGLTPTILTDLSEVNLGQWDGQQLKTLEQSGLESYRAWRVDPEKNPPPGGERILSVGRRVLQTLAEFIRTHQEHGLTVAATHADCLKGACLVIMNAEGPATRRMLVPNTGQVLLRHWDNGRWSIVLSPLYFR